MLPELEHLAKVHTLSAQATAVLSTYVHAVDTWRSSNITGLSTEVDVVDRLVADSLALLDLPQAQAAATDGARWLDLGSGAGVPGLPLAVVLPGIDMTLLESVGRKCAFLRHAVDVCDVGERVHVECARSEIVSAHVAHRDAYERVVARALGPVPVVIELAAPLLALGGKVLVCTSGARAHADEERAARAAQVCGLGPPHSVPLERSPLKDSVCVVATKERPTPDWLPRRPGVARKRPLGR